MAKPESTEELLWYVEWLMSLCAQPSPSGQESLLLPVLYRILKKLDATTHEQVIGPNRSNILATWGRPRVLFTTHVDTVPGYTPPRINEGRVFGRGACDAKGQVVSQLGAIRQLLNMGQTHFAWLGIAGEETDSAGANAASLLAPMLPDVTAVINGEPTNLCLATGQRGIVHLRLLARGRAAHSATPERGQNAIWLLMDCLNQIRQIPMTQHASLGEETWNLGLFQGGVASNVIPAAATADLLVRTVPDSTFVESVRRLLPSQIELQVLLDEAPATYPVIPGFASITVPFSSDLPTVAKLAPAASMVLAGPGTIDQCHIDDESIGVQELYGGIQLNRRLAIHFLNQNPSSDLKTKHICK